MKTTELNTHICTNLNLAAAAATHLTQRGHEILEVSIQGRNPTIWIAPPKRHLPSARVIRRIGPARAVYHVAECSGCLVQWEPREEDRR